MTFSEGLSASNLCPSHRVIRVHADSGMTSSMRGGSQLNAACSASRERACSSVPTMIHGRACSHRAGAYSGPIRAGACELLTNDAASLGEGMCHWPRVVDKREQCSTPRGGAPMGAGSRGTQASAVGSPGRARSAWPSPRARRSEGRSPACRASSASLARTRRIENAPMAAVEEVKRPQ